jgi:Pyruvate/2-oxoacid:ferredoxin oxidoreductase gamma subunit
MLGAFVGASGVVSEESVIKVIETEFIGRKEKFIPANIAAFRAGASEGRAADRAPEPVQREEVAVTSGGEG